MLVLTRKLMEKLFIGDNICVTVVRLEGGQVRLGIEAPREISVVRAELVPDRQFGTPRRPPNAPHTPPPAGPAPESTSAAGGTPSGESSPMPGRSDVTTPPAWARGNDNRRRGRSR
jgi:carbon storage regulator